MRLYEHEGKALLAEHGIAVPRGALWPELPDVSGPLVVKAQVLRGGRGKQGGIRFVTGKADCAEAVRSLLGSSIGGETIERFFVEERLEIERELYVAALIDRDSWSPMLLTSGRGGMDIEDAPATEVMRLPIDPLLGLRPFAVRHAISRLGLSARVAGGVTQAIQAIHRTLIAAEAELVEVNPLVVTSDGTVIAVDAKVVLDDEAGFRHPERPSGPREGTAFERRCASRGAVGVEMDGDVAIVVSGAGLMMATIDLLGAAGVRLRAAVDLGGVAFGGPEHFAEVIRSVVALSPKTILVNAFFNLAFCDVLAEGIVAGLAGQHYAGGVVVRLRGRRLDEAKAILRRLEIGSYEDLSEAIGKVIALSRGVPAWPS